MANASIDQVCGYGVYFCVFYPTTMAVGPVAVNGVPGGLPGGVASGRKCQEGRLAAALPIFPFCVELIGRILI